MKRWTWQRAVLAGTLTTVAFAVWRWGFSPVVSEGTYVPWTIAGLIAAVATVCTDRVTHPFVGATTTAVAAGLAELITDRRAGLDASDLPYLVLSVMVLAAGVSGLHLLFVALPRTRQPWAAVVVALGGLAVVVWMGWWSVDGSSPAEPNTFLVGAVCTLVIATVLGEITVGTWFGGVFAVAPAALLLVPPLATTDALWLIGWIILSAGAAATCLTAVGVVAAVRGGYRRLRPALR